MKVRDPKDAASRRAVAELVRRFFADLTAQLAAGTAEIWNRVERRPAHPSREDEAGGRAPRSPGHAQASMPPPMQPQPMQQQQQKKTEEEK